MNTVVARDAAWMRAALTFFGQFFGRGIAWKEGFGGLPASWDQILSSIILTDCFFAC